MDSPYESSETESLQCYVDRFALPKSLGHGDTLNRSNFLCDGQRQLWSTYIGIGAGCCWRWQPTPSSGEQQTCQSVDVLDLDGELSPI